MQVHKEAERGQKEGGSQCSFPQSNSWSWPGQPVERRSTAFGTLCCLFCYNSVRKGTGASRFPCFPLLCFLFPKQLQLGLGHRITRQRVHPECWWPPHLLTMLHHITTDLLLAPPTCCCFCGLWGRKKKRTQQNTFSRKQGNACEDERGVGRRVRHTHILPSTI